MKAVVTRKAEKAVVPRNATIRSLLLATCHLLVVIMLKVMEKRMKNRGKSDFHHTSCCPFSVLPYTAQPSVAGLTEPSLSFPVQFCSQDCHSLSFPNCASCAPLLMCITKQIMCMP